MSMVIRNNIAALRTYDTMNANQTRAQKSLTRVATGEKINGTADDSSAYSISERMRNRIRSLEQAHRNAQNGSSMLRTAEGAVANILEIVKTLKEKAIDSANDANTDEDRKTLQKEFNQLVEQVNDNALVTFNGKILLDSTRNNATVSTLNYLSNENLALNTGWLSPLSSLKNRRGESFGIKDDDRILWSITSNVNGTWHGELTGRNSFYDFEDDIGDVSGYSLMHLSPGGDYRNKFNEKIIVLTNGLMRSPERFGSEGEVYSVDGLSLKVIDSQGNINKFATAQLQFTEINRAEAKTGDRALSFQVGTEANVATKFALTDMRAGSLGLQYWWDGEDEPEYAVPRTTISISTQKDANAAIDALDRTVKRVLDQQTAIGAALARLEYTATNLTTSTENVRASESTIRDSDMAREITNYTRDNMLSRSSQAMLAAANQEPTDALALLS